MPVLTVPCRGFELLCCTFSLPVQADVESFQKQRYMAAFTDFGDKREYIEFLEKELEQAKYEEGGPPCNYHLNWLNIANEK